MALGPQIEQALSYADNVEPTYFNASQGNTNILDMFFLNDSAEREMENLEVMSEIGSDHKPVKLTCRGRKLKRNPKITFEVVKEEETRREMEKAAMIRMGEWDRKEWVTSGEAEKEVQAITDEWTRIKKNASFTKTIRTRNGVTLSEESRRLIKEMRRAGRERTRSDLGLLEADEARRRHNRLKREVRKKVREDERKGILECLKRSTEKGDPAGTWRVLNNTMGRNVRDEWIYPIRDSRGVLQEREEEIVKIHMNRMKDTCSLANDPRMDDEFKRIVEEEIDNSEAITDQRAKTAWGWKEKEEEDTEFGDEDFVTIISKETFNEQINKTKVKAAPGPDGITNKDIRALGPLARCMWRRLMQILLRLGVFPEIWKLATVSMISKPNKPKDESSSYRPVSLTSSVGKLLERFIGLNMDRVVSQRNLQSERQSGFTAGRGTGEALLRLVEDVHVAFKKNGAVGLVCLDLEKAFDKLWPAGLIYKLIHAGLPTKLIRILANFMKERRMEIKVGKTKSEEFQIEAGCPQGAINSPRIYKFYTRDVPVIPSMAENGAGYADDLSEWAAGFTIQQINEILQEALDAIEAWARRWRLKISPTKSQGMVFTRNRDLMKSKLKLTLDGSKIPQEKSVKLLGVTLDGYLSWSVEIDKIKAKSENAALQVRKLAKQIGRIEPELVKQAYEALVMSPIHYSSAMWIGMGENQWKKIIRSQERTIKWIWGYPSCINGRRALEDSGTRTVREVIEDRTSKKIKKILKNAPFGHAYLERWCTYKSENRHTSLLQNYTRLPKNDILTLFDCGWCNFAICHTVCTGNMQIQNEMPVDV